MDSSKFNVLEKSTRECTTESALDPESTASTSTNTGPSTEHQDPHTDVSTTQSQNNSSTRLLGRPRPQYSAIGVPVPANGQPIGTETEEQMGVQACTSVCRTFWNWYKNSAIDFRNSCFIHIFHLLFSYIPISGIIMGLLFSRECPHSSFLPIFVTVAGVIGIFFICLWIATSCYERSGTPYSNLQKGALAMLLGVLLVIVVFEMCLVSHLSPNFDVTAEDYCSKRFYHFVIGKEIATGAALIVSALLYFPESGLHTCCQTCPVPSPASAFFSSL